MLDLESTQLVLTVNLKPGPIEVLEKCLQGPGSSRLKLVTVSPLEQESRLVELAKLAALIFVYWEGSQSASFNALRKMLSGFPHCAGRIHMVYDGGLPPKKPAVKKNPLENSTLQILDARQSQPFGIASWINFPDRYLELERLVFNLTSAPLAAEASSGVTTSSELAELPEISTRDVLQKTVEASNRIVQAIKKIDDALRDPQARPPLRRIAVFHPDSARATEIAKLLVADTAYVVEMVSHQDEMLAMFQRDINAVVIWFDGMSQESQRLLRQIAENRAALSVPIALLLPDQGAITKLKEQLPDLFFDIVIIYSRMRIALNTSLKTLADANNHPDTPRNLLERLRRPMRPGSPPEFQKTATLQMADTLSQRLGQKPGKRGWAEGEMIPYLIREGRYEEAKTKVQKVCDQWPDSFYGPLLSYILSCAWENEKTTSPKPLIDIKSSLQTLTHLLARKDLSPSRLLQLGSTAFYYKLTTHTLKILQIWQDRPQWREEPEFYFLGGHYLILRGLNPKPYYARAVSMDPERLDFIAAFGEALAQSSEFSYAISFLRPIIHSPICPWSTKVTFVRTLKGDRQLKEARQIIDQLMLEAPGNKDLAELTQGMLLSA